MGHPSRLSEPEDPPKPHGGMLRAEDFWVAAVCVAREIGTPVARTLNTGSRLQAQHRLLVTAFLHAAHWQLRSGHRAMTLIYGGESYGTECKSRGIYA